MNKKKIVLLGFSLVLAAGLSACGSLASSAAADDFADGKVNSGADQDVGTVNTGTDANSGVVNDGLTGNVDGIDVGGSSMRDADGNCINNTDAATGDLLCNEEDSDIDGDGTPNTKDDDIDGDKIANGSDSDMDGDGFANIDDNDMDGDGLANENDSDMDGDGDLNILDDDMDGDNVTNINDNDMDGDGVVNTEDPDMDGDGIKNEDDADMDGDGVLNENDNDMDGDGVANATDPDMDGDGVANAADPDMDGDDIANTVDPDANGDGLADNNSTESAKLAYFDEDGYVTLAVAAGFSDGTSAPHTLDLTDLRQEAEDNDADVGTITPYDVQITVDAASQAALASLGNIEYDMYVSYTDPSTNSTLVIARTPSATAQYTSGLVSGVSFANDQLMKTENYATFQGLFGKTQYTSCELTVRLVLKTKAPVSADITLNYLVKANAKVVL